MTRHYDRAPIVEAVIEICVAPSASFDADNLNRIATILLHRFPSSTAINAISMEYQPNVGEPVGTFRNAQRQIGTRFESADRTRVLQLFPAKFAYSHLAPYSEWTTFQAEAQGLWSEFRDATRPGAITRLAVRAINKIRFPAPISEYSNYTTLRFHLPESAGIESDGCFAQFQIDASRWIEGGRAILNCGAARLDDRYSELLLDTDIFVASRREAHSKEIWHSFGQLNDGNDDLFETLITDLTRELIS